MASVTTPIPPGVAHKAAARTVGAVKVYGKGQTEVRALDGVTVEFVTGRYTAIMGPSGSGKSTLLHCVAGLDTLTSGQAFIGDADLSTLNDQQLTILRRDRVGFVFQSFNLVPTITAAENINLPLLLAGRRGDQEWISKIIDTMGIGSRLKHRPDEMSGGQQQRVAVARALASRPEIIFADEPTGNLDSRAGAEVLTFMPLCAGPWTRWARRSSWSRTTRPRPATPTGSCSLLTGGSWTRCSSPRPSACWSG